MIREAMASLMLKTLRVASLLLDKCVASGKIDLTMADLREICNKAAGFAQEIRARTKGEMFEWNWYV